jgi:mevalonate kinase
LTTYHYTLGAGPKAIRPVHYERKDKNMVKVHGTAIKSLTYVNTYQAERLSPNDVLSLQLKYKNDPEVLAILARAVDPHEAIEEAIEEHDSESEELAELIRIRQDVDDSLEDMEDKLTALAETLFEDEKPTVKDMDKAIEGVLILLSDLKDRTEGT